MNEASLRLPQQDGGWFLTDGGIETVLIFHEGLDLPLFAAFDLLKDEQGTELLRRYYAPYLALARERGLGFVLESPTWRATRAGRARSATTASSSLFSTARRSRCSRRSATSRKPAVRRS